MDEAENIATLIEAAIREVYGRSQGAIPLHSPYFKGAEWQYVRSCLESGWVSSVGAYVERFEQEIENFTGAQNAVATVNGTSALHMALMVSGIEAGDEVLCPAFSFVGTVTPVVYCGAYPVFMDIDAKTMGIDPEKILRFISDRCTRGKDGLTYNRETGRRVKACIQVHTYGYPAEMKLLLDVCNEHNVVVIEDAAEALGSFRDNRHCGTFAKLGILSFNGNKIVTTGGGGMILTDDDALAKRARHLTTTAKVRHPWKIMHDEVGYNYRMPNLNAALGCAQMEMLSEFLRKKKEQALEFHRALSGKGDLEVVVPACGGANHWFNLVKLNPKHRNAVLSRLNEKGIQARAGWTLICDMTPYGEYETYEVEVAKELTASLICLPNGLLD